MKDNNYLREIVSKMDNSTPIGEIQKYINEMIAIRGWRDETPQDTMLLLTEELGELAKEVRKSCTKIQNDVSKNKTSNLNGEIGDVFLMLLALCRTLDVDVIDAFREKEIINCDRKWA